MMSARWSRRLYQAVSIVVLCTLILPPGLVGAVGLPQEPTPEPPAVPTETVIPTETATPTATETITSTEAVIPTETMMPKEMITLTETVTSTEILPVTPTDVFTPTEEVVEPAPPTSTDPLSTTSAPTLLIQVTPECVAPGELVTLTLTVMQPEKAERLNVAAVTATLPAELQWLPQRSEWLYTDASRELRTALPTLDAGSTATYSLQFRADGKPGQTVEVLFALVDAEGVQTTSRASVWVSLPAQAEVDARGGRLQSADGRVQVAFPESVVTQAATVIHTPRFQRTVEGRGAAQRFELNLYATDGGTLPLNTPVTVTINVSGLLDLTPSFDHWPYLAYLDEKTGEWQPVLVRADADAGTLTAQVEHFSVWETGMAGALKSGWHLLYNAPQVSTFSGAASFSYPIEVLPGAGGMQPQVSLSYNSRRVDGIMSWIQSDWAGLGWSVDTIEVVRKVGREATYNSYQNKFTLLLNGTSYQLIKDSGYSAAYGRYYTADYSGLHIMRCNDFSTAITECATIPANNLTGEFWIIRTPQGLTYRLGDTAGSEQVIGGMYWWGGEYFTGGQRADADYYAGHASGYVTYR